MIQFNAIRHRPLTVALLLLAAQLPDAARAGDFVDAVRRDTEALCRYPSRVLGTPGHDAAKEALAERIAALEGVTLVRQPFPLNVPVTDRAVITVARGELAGDHPVHPVWPDNVRLKSTPAEGISGPTVYIGEGHYEALPAKSLRGAVAAIEMSTYASDNWMRAFDFGARAVLLLGSAKDRASPPSYTPYFKPRYYIPDGPLANALRAGTVGEVTIHCDARWHTATGENLLALMRGTDTSLPPIILVASYDAMSVVPTVAPGADNAVDAAFMLTLLTYLTEHPPKRGVLVGFIDAFGHNLTGMRELMAMLTLTEHDLTRQAYDEHFARRLEEYEELATTVEELGDDLLTALTKLTDKTRYLTLQRYAKDVLSPEILKTREEIFDLRLAEANLKGEAAEAASALKEKKLRRKADLDSVLSGIIFKGTLPEELIDEGKTVWETIRDRVATQLTEQKERGAVLEAYDALRAEVFAAMGFTAPDPIAFPFIFGVDLSDCGITVGPSYRCEVLLATWPQGTRAFDRWLKTLIKDEGNPYVRVPAERLSALGVRADGLGPVVDRILNHEAIDLAGAQEAMSAVVPGVSEAAVQRVLNAIRAEKPHGAARVNEVAFRALLKELPQLEGDQAEQLVRDILNRESMRGGVDPSSVAVERLPLLSSVAASFQTSGVTWSTLEGLRPRLDTPQDTFERLDWNRLTPQLHITALLIEMLLNDPEFTPTPSPARPGTYPRWRMPEGVVVSESVAETIARTPDPGMLVTTYNRHKLQPPAGFRGHEFVLSGADGRFWFRPAPCHSHWSARRRFLWAYGIAEDGRIIRSIATIKSMLNARDPGLFALTRNPPLAPLRGETFECIEVNGPRFRDPRYQRPLFGGRVLDVGRGGIPKKHVWNATAGPMFGLLQPNTRFQLILGGGGTNRMILINVAEDLNTKGRSLREAIQTGFPADKPLPALPELISARDFFRIDEWRLRRLEGAGVVCEAIREIHEETRVKLEAADKAFEEDRGAAYKRAANAALANEIRVYQAVQDQADDVTRGAIFLLLLLVPFAIAMERLLFASPEIARQIGRSMAIFVVMFVILCSFHPGFRITSMPAVILIAFMVLLLSVSVINMVLSKFRADMEELRRGTLAEASGAQTGRGGVIASAIWLGIANMRKRFLRTLLTGLTIVLVTFSLLCFTSSSTYKDTRTTTLDGITSTHDGALLQHPSSQELDPETVESVALMLGGDKTVVGRYWVTNSEPNWRLHIRAADTGRLVTLKAALGLEPDEARFSAVKEVLPNWERFAEGGGCYLSKATAERLGVTAGDTVVVAGTALELIAAYDGRAVERGEREPGDPPPLLKLDGQPLLPLDYTVRKDDSSMADAATMEAVMAAGGAAEPDPSLVYVSGDETIILPVPLALDLGASLRSIAVRSDTTDARTLANALMRIIVYPIYFGAGDKVKAIVSTPLLPKAPRNLLIPILIAALIIFNTMLNSIAERKKEIYIYSSLGLAPRHIGVLFLGEALTYGLMGSVFGYIIGQGAATVLTHFNLMGGITLNYSGSNVILTMGLVLTVVIASALVPAFMAAKVASPSGDLDWKVPAPENGVIKAQLPFTVSRQAAPGLAAFLYEYFDAHGDGAIGCFTSDKLQLEPGDDNVIVRLKSVIWPAPYDLGVRQRVTIDFTGSEADICDLHVRLEHDAGQERSWWRLNRVFLGDIRNQLLGWRNIAPERMLNYIRQATGDRDRAPDAPDAPAEAAT